MSRAEQCAVAIAVGRIRSSFVAQQLAHNIHRVRRAVVSRDYQRQFSIRASYVRVDPGAKQSDSTVVVALLECAVQRGIDGSKGRCADQTSSGNKQCAGYSQGA